MSAHTAAALNLPPLSTVDEFAARVGYSPDRIRRCIRATTPDKHGWPPLPAKRMPDGKLRITAADGADWINNLPDA